jgi:allantoinase
MWTEARARGFSLEHLAKWLCSAPARQVGFQVLKGSIRKEADADIVIWNPEAEFRVTPEMIQHRHKLTPYLGETLRGVVEKTFVSGQIVYDNGEFVGGPLGRIILRGDDGLEAGYRPPPSRNENGGQ